ncbi:hypothetical protein GJ496_000424 [Pomphorhynchus laevis]|nr:hypothetical protein GJ496_000424 [Pomphorhynchus laevis]
MIDMSVQSIALRSLYDPCSEEEQRGNSSKDQASPIVSPKNDQKNKCCRLMNSIVRFDLICDPSIAVLCLANLFGFFAFLLVMMLLVTVTEKQIGTSAVQARFTMTCLGITNTIGRFLFGWLPGPKTCTIATINYISLAICGLICFLLPLFRNYSHAMIFAVIFGLFTAPFVGLTPAVIREAVGDKLYNDALGLAFFFRGFSSVIGPTLGGYIYDTTGSYNLPFFISGCAFLICAVLHFIVKWTYKIKCGMMYSRIPKEDDETYKH